MHRNVFFFQRRSFSFCCSTIKKFKELSRRGIAKIRLGFRELSVSVELMTFSEDSCLFIFIRHDNRCDEVLTELFFEWRWMAFLLGPDPHQSSRNILPIEQGRIGSWSGFAGEDSTWHKCEDCEVSSGGVVQIHRYRCRFLYLPKFTAESPHALAGGWMPPYWKGPNLYQRKKIWLSG